MKKRCTLKDISKRVDLAPTTVSRILNDKPTYCSEAKIAMVHKVAEELGYIRNLGYQIMTGAKTRTIGIMVSCAEYMQEEHVHNVILQLMEKLSRKGYFSACHVLSTDPKEALASVTDYLSHGVERFIFLGMPFGCQEIFALLDKLNIPYIGNRSTMKRYVFVNMAGARRNILKIFREKCGSNFRLFWKYSAIDIACKELGVPGELCLGVEQTGDDFYCNAFEEGYSKLASAMKSVPGLRGAMFQNDAYALGAANYLLEHGIKDFILAGCNGDRIVMRFPYPMYTAVYDAEKLTELLCEKVLTDEPCQIAVEVAHINTKTGGLL